MNPALDSMRVLSATLRELEKSALRVAAETPTAKIIIESRAEARAFRTIRTMLDKSILSVERNV